MTSYPESIRQPLAPLRRQLETRDRDAPIEVRGWELFELVCQLGFTRITYSAFQRVSDGAFWWVTRDHGGRIGAALPEELAYLALQVTCFEEGALQELAARVPSGSRVEELVIAHKSADEVTRDQAEGLAAAVHALGARTLRLWAGDFDPGVLERLVERLRELGNRSLVEVDVCDITLPEPEDRIVEPALEALVGDNRRAPA